MSAASGDLKVLNGVDEGFGLNISVGFLVDTFLNLDSLSSASRLSRSWIKLNAYSSLDLADLRSIKVKRNHIVCK